MAESCSRDPSLGFSTDRATKGFYLTFLDMAKRNYNTIDMTGDISI